MAEGAIIATWEGEALLAQVEGGSKFDWRIEAIEIPGHIPEGDPPNRTWKPVTVSLATSHRLYLPIFQWLHRECRHDLERVWAAHVHRTDHREYQPEVA
jgi:hypothetical protein